MSVGWANCKIDILEIWLKSSSGREFLILKKFLYLALGVFKMLLYCVVGILRVVEKWKVTSYVNIHDICCDTVAQVRLHSKTNKDIDCHTVIPAMSKVCLSQLLDIGIVSGDIRSVLYCYSLSSLLPDL